MPSAAIFLRSPSAQERQDFQSKRKNWWSRKEPSSVSGTGGKLAIGERLSIDYSLIVANHLRHLRWGQLPPARRTNGIAFPPLAQKQELAKDGAPNRIRRSKGEPENIPPRLKAQLAFGPASRGPHAPASSEY